MSFDYFFLLSSIMVLISVGTPGGRRYVSMRRAALEAELKSIHRKSEREWRKQQLKEELKIREEEKKKQEEEEKKWKEEHPGELSPWERQRKIAIKYLLIIIAVFVALYILVFVFFCWLDGDKLLQNLGARMY